MTFPEISNVVIGAIIGGIIGSGFIGYWVAHRIARKSGSFKKKQFDVFLFGHSLISRPPRQVIFGYPTAVRPDDIVICYLPIRIDNTGDLSIKEIVVNWKINSLFRIEGVPGYIKSTFQLGEKSVKRKVHKDKNFHYICYIIPKIDPNMCILLRESVNINACNWPFQTTALTKDKIPLEVTGRLNLNARVEISVSATDMPSIFRTFTIKGYQVESEKQLFDEISKPDLEAMKRQLKQACPKTSDSRIEEVADKLTKMGGLPHMEAIVIMPKLNKKVEYDNLFVFEQDIAESSIAYVTTEETRLHELVKKVGLKKEDVEFTSSTGRVK